MMGNGQKPPMHNLAQKNFRCSNPECEFHLKDCVFRQEVMAVLTYNVLDPDQMAPIPVAFKFTCVACGWIFKPGKTPGEKHSTVNPKTGTTEEFDAGEEWKKG